MPKTITLSDSLYKRLECAMRESGMKSFEQLLKDWFQKVSELKRRKKAFEDVMAFHSQIKDQYGELPDSVPGIREDRDR